MADEPAGVVVTGVSGRMGRMLVQAVQEQDRLALVGAVEREGHPWIGTDLGETLGGAPVGVQVTDDVREPLTRAQVVLDFTAPAATVATAAIAAEAGAVHVIGTTGLTDTDIDRIDTASHRAVIVRAGNMSLGVNLLVQLTRQVAAALDADFDIEVVEAHHRHKVDAPSGTALMLGQAAAKGRDVPLSEAYVAARDGITGVRTEGSIGFSAIRGGDIIGDHDVIFAGPGERIVLTHKASDRSLFAKGAVKAALWGLGQQPGHYSMLDVLGLSG
ncbi:MAG: 4-hydroxy-tetrahydrodipicolinate reductase [Pseudomonadota bacterium]